MITVLILLIALGVLGWGFYRALPLGKLGILAWLQSVVLMLPWLLFFGLSTAGIFLNLVSVLFLFVGSTLVYIALGRRIRTLAGDEKLIQSLSVKTAASEAAPTDASEAAPSEPVAAAKPEPSQPTVEPTLPAEDLQAIRGIFGIDTFFATEVIPYQNGAIFKGNLRGEPEPSYDRLSTALRERLDDRYRLFLVEGVEQKPVVVVLPSSSDPKPVTLLQILLSVILGGVTIATCLETSGILLGFDWFTAPDRFREVLPIGGGLIGVLLAHELAHWVLAKRYQIRLSPPFFLPVLQIGSFGAITRFASLLPNRTVLFDIAFAGTAVGGAVALMLLLAGLLLSNTGSFLQIPSEFFQGSILVGTLAKVLLGTALQQPLINIHPLVIVGWLGLVITAINVLPAGQLDGGRMMQAVYGRRVAARTTIGTLILLGLAALVNPLALYWAIVILFVQRDLERPALNELTEPNDTRAALYLLILFLMAATLLPLTPSLAGRLGIGG
ncbi:site-2 protease family protein [Phormidium tenue FACHB-886]|nr:site-2 protease family protein [Phormidium tenue FACHB-886]